MYYFSLNEDGSLKGESYLEQLILFLFNPIVIGPKSGT